MDRWCERGENSGHTKTKGRMSRKGTGKRERKNRGVEREREWLE